MAELRALATGLGYTRVRTVLNSGNIVFDVPEGDHGDAAVRMEQAMVKQLGVSSRITVVTAAELAAAVTANPLHDIATDPTRLLVAVPATPADRSRLEPLLRMDWAPEKLALGRRVAYLWCPDGILAGRLPAAVNRILDGAVTTRNWSTVTKLYDIIQDEP